MTKASTGGLLGSSFGLRRWFSKASLKCSKTSVRVGCFQADDRGMETPSDALHPFSENSSSGGGRMG